MFKNCLLGLSLLLFYTCAQDRQDANGDFQATPVDGTITNADLIRNPVAVDGQLDSVNVARMDFVSPDYNFGTVTEGDIVENAFHFTNTGRVPLLISDARATCGCTVPNWPKHPIPPGDSGTITVVFDTKNKNGQQAKPITITANTFPSTTEVRLLGRVEKQ